MTFTRSPFVNARRLGLGGGGGNRMTPEASARALSASISRSGQRAGQSPTRTKHKTPKQKLIDRHCSTMRTKK
jgi:hypothetical protein